MLICHNLYGEVSFQVLYPSFHAVEFHIFQNIYICGYKSCIRYVICRYFLSIVTWSFLFLSMSSAEQKCFNLIKSNLSIFSCISSVQFSRSVMSDSVTPWIAARQASVHHQLLEFTQTHIHRVGDAIQPSHPLSYPSSPAPNPSQHQSLFQWVNSAWGGQSTGVSALKSFLPKKSQGWSPSEWTGWISLQSKGLPRVFSNTTVQKHQFFGAQPSSQSNSHIHTWPQEKP